MGIIDRNGNVLKKRKEFTDQEKRSFSRMDSLILRLRKLVSSNPVGASVISGFVPASLYLIKEGIEAVENGHEPTDDELMEMLETYTTYAQELLEDAPTNSAGSGAIAGIGVGPDGEPGLDKKAIARHKKRNKMIRRRPWA
jgi:hypothetical protein